MKVLIVYAHPTPESFNGAVLEAFTGGLEEAGHTSETVDLYAIGFAPCLNSEEIVAQFTGGQLPQDVLEQQEKVAQADVLAFIYPVWWWRGPAILEGWADRVLTPGCAYQFTEQGTEGLLGDKKAILINSVMGAEEYYTNSGIGDAMRKVARTVFADGCGIQDIEHVFLYAAHDVDDDTRKGYLKSVYNLGKVFSDGGSLSMLDELRDQMAVYLSEHRVCILSTVGSEGAWAMPVHYRSLGLEIDCLLPRWADVVYHLEQEPTAMLVIQDASTPALRWLQCWGAAQPVERPDWQGLLPEGASTAVSPGDLYLVVRMKPKRIDLVDEGQGWGVRETLNL